MNDPDLDYERRRHRDLVDDLHERDQTAPSGYRPASPSLFPYPYDAPARVHDLEEPK